MNERNVEKNDEIQLDLKRLLKAVWSRKVLIAVISVLCAAVTLLGTLMFVTPMYEASAMFYVNNNNSGESSLSSITSSDITASKNLVSSYIIILKTKESLMSVIEYANVNLTYDELEDMITAGSVDETEIFRVVVTSDDPQEAAAIANAIAAILPDRISSIIEGTSAKMVDDAVVPSSPSSPSYVNNTILGFLLGLIVVVGVIILREIFDVTIRTEEDVTQISSYPVLASVPDMGAPSKGGHEYGADRKKKNTAVQHHGAPAMIGGDISFAASEAYKLLRTKLQFSFADESDCRVIGVSSSLSGEGKSLSSINLAYTLAQMDKKVVLIDCDMRRPTLAEKLRIQRKPGLSDFLSGQVGLNGLIRYCGIKGDETAFHVLPAGQNPPNPIELLSSTRMASLLNGMRKIYDYIILDLPPVGEVSDAMAVAKETDGILLVVRQNYCNRMAFADTIQQFEFIGARILGVVCNCAVETDGKYGKGYYKRYYGREDTNQTSGNFAAAKKAGTGR